MVKRDYPKWADKAMYAAVFIIVLLAFVILMQQPSELEVVESQTDVPVPAPMLRGIEVEKVSIGGVDYEVPIYESALEKEGEWIAYQMITETPFKERALDFVEELVGLLTFASEAQAATRPWVVEDNKSKIKATFYYSKKSAVEKVVVNTFIGGMDTQRFIMKHILKEDWSGATIKHKRNLQICYNSLVMARSRQVFVNMQLLGMIKQKGRVEGKEADYLIQHIARFVKATERQCGFVFREEFRNAVAPALASTK